MTYPGHLENVVIYTIEEFDYGIPIENQDEYELVPDIKPKFKVGDRIRKEGSYISGVVVEIDKDYYYKVEYKEGSVSYVNIKAQDNWELVKNDIKHKFKVGDKIKQKGSPRCYIISSIEFDRYRLSNNQFLRFVDEKIYELAYDKFDISTLKPFKSRVLVRDTNTEKWKSNFWGFYDIDHVMNYPYECCGSSYAQCIPYKGNEHLLNTTNDYDEFYKTW